MLDPELFDQLAAHPEKNAPAVNVALAEEGHGLVLLQLARSAAVPGDALAVVAERMEREGEALAPPPDDGFDEDTPSLLSELDRLLIAHPNAPASVRDAVLERHAREAFYVLAAASHADATLGAIERAALWPCRYTVYDRLWLPLIPSRAIAPLIAEEWAQDPEPLRRELVARIWSAAELLERLVADPSRQVRRALASNPHANHLRERLAAADPAPEVRARASAPLGEHDAGPPSVGPARFAAALRAMESGGVLAPDVAGALSEQALDEEGASLAAQVLPSARVVSLIRSCSEHPAPTAAEVGLAVGMALRKPEDTGGDKGLRELVAEAAKALTQASDRYGALTGKARLAAWVGEGLAASRVLEHERLLEDVCSGAIGGEGPILARGAGARPALLVELARVAQARERVPPSLLELAWHDPSFGDEQLLSMARNTVRAKRRGRDLPDDEIDLDPGARSLELLEQVVLTISRQVTVSPRAALAVVALDSRRVRYVLTAMPQWRGPLCGSMLSRVLKQNAGALSAARSEARSRASEVRSWTERMMSDTELAVALGIGHYTAAALVERVRSGRHKLEDGVSVAAGADARAVLEGVSAIEPLLRWSAQNRSQEGGALALWMLLERHDRERPAGMIASSIDSLSVKQQAVSEGVAEALAVMERRRPGRLETVLPNTPRGRATLASAIARAYRAIGGLRDER